MHFEPCFQVPHPPQLGLDWASCGSKTQHGKPRCRTTRGWFPDTDPLALTPEVTELKESGTSPNNMLVDLNWIHQFSMVILVNSSLINWMTPYWIQFNIPSGVIKYMAGKSPRNGSILVDFPAQKLVPSRVEAFSRPAGCHHGSESYRIIPIVCRLGSITPYINRNYRNYSRCNSSTIKRLLYQWFPRLGYLKTWWNHLKSIHMNAFESGFK